MTRRGLIILMVAVLAVGFAAAAIASSIGGSDESTTHVMPNGQTMEGGTMDDSGMSGSGMDDGSMDDMGMGGN